MDVLIAENRLKHLLIARNISAERAALKTTRERYLSEINDLYEEQGDLNTKLQCAYEEKSQAYDNLNSAKQSIDRWHSKSKSNFPIYGNSHKKLPKHSLFGQSFGDLEAHKSRRASAVNDIDSAKRRISRFKEKRYEASQRISEFKEKVRAVTSQDRSLQSTLLDQEFIKRSGYSKEILDNEYPRLIAERKVFQEKLDAVQAYINELAAHFTATAKALIDDL